MRCRVLTPTQVCLPLHHTSQVECTQAGSLGVRVYMSGVKLQANLHSSQA